MANEEHVDLLIQGVKVWNQWRTEYKNIVPDLRGADFYRAALKGVNLAKADLREAGLSDAVLYKADLREADLREASLYRADLRDAVLSDAALHGANLRDADLCGADLYGANLYGTILHGTDFQMALFGFTSFSNLDLSVAKNLNLIRHTAPSTLGIDTLMKSKGKIPIEFLEGCGVPEIMITFAKSLVGTPIEYYSSFISHSTKDAEFCQRLFERMKGEKLRVWYAPEELKAGRKIHEEVDNAIRYHDKLIIVLSEASMSSAWVETEIKNAKEQERETKRRKLFPISLVPFEEIRKWKLFNADDGRDLAREIREFYIPDFSNWKNYDSFNREFEKLLKALQAEE